MDLMHGTIELTSEYGHGTQATVEVTFDKDHSNTNSPPHRGPHLLAPTTTTTAPPSATAAQRKHEDLWVLVAEDNDLNREIVVKMLTLRGFNVGSVTNGQQAIDALHERVWDIVL